MATLPEHENHELQALALEEALSVGHTQQRRAHAVEQVLHVLDLLGTARVVPLVRLETNTLTRVHTTCTLLRLVTSIRMHYIALVRLATKHLLQFNALLYVFALWEASCCLSILRLTLDLRPAAAATRRSLPARPASGGFLQEQQPALHMCAFSLNTYAAKVNNKRVYFQGVRNRRQLTKTHSS